LENKSPPPFPKLCNPVLNPARQVDCYPSSLPPWLPFLFLSFMFSFPPPNEAVVIFAKIRLLGASLSSIFSISRAPDPFLPLSTAPLPCPSHLFLSSLISRSFMFFDVQAQSVILRRGIILGRRFAFAPTPSFTPRAKIPPLLRPLPPPSFNPSMVPPPPPPVLLLQTIQIS